MFFVWENSLTKILESFTKNTPTAQLYFEYFTRNTLNLGIFYYKRIKLGVFTRNTLNLGIFYYKRIKLGVFTRNTLNLGIFYYKHIKSTCISFCHIPPNSCLPT